MGPRVSSADCCSDNTLAHFLLMSRQHMALRAASALMCLSASTICTQVLGHQLLLCCGVTAYLLEHGLLSIATAIARAV